MSPEKIEIKREILPNYQIKIADFCNIPIGNFNKSVPNFFDKEKYVLHCQNLQLYLKLGLKLKKIHRVLECNQSQLLKSYTKNNRSRKKATQRLKIIVQINRQCCIWQSNGKLEEQN